jgi:hypothetical protein
MHTNTVSLNPFSLLMEPELVLQAMERSQGLRNLRRQKFHPLDKPLIPYAKAHLATIDFDLEIDESEDDLEYELND